MIRIVIVSFLLVEGFLVAKAQQIQASILQNNIGSELVQNCSVIEGDASGCLDCYICDKGASNKQILRNKKLHHIKLYDENCQRREFCCYSQRESTGREMDYCGKSEPNGYPRSMRDRLRSVLQGQYPWRTWIFSIGSTMPLCAGVYFNYDKRAILTSATCLQNYFGGELLVGFTRSEGNIRVRDDVYFIHDEHVRGTHINDIAMITLSQDNPLPPWAHPVCLPSTKPPIATACIAVSDQDLYVSSLILKQSSCVIDESSLDQSLLCAVSPIKNDYIPEEGGGLFCEKGAPMNNFKYVLNGIHLYKTDSFSVYTNISHFIEWIEARLDDIKIN